MLLKKCQMVESLLFIGAGAGAGEKKTRSWVSGVLQRALCFSAWIYSPEYSSIKVLWSEMWVYDSFKASI